MREDHLANLMPHFHCGLGLARKKQHVIMLSFLAKIFSTAIAVVKKLECGTLFLSASYPAHASLLRDDGVPLWPGLATWGTI